jgi:hypothetical protein
MHNDASLFANKPSFGVLLARMADVSEFMKTLKQRFSVWFNKSHGRYGTLW